MPWFKSATPQEPLAVTMTGVKLGDRLLIIGCAHAKLVAQLALKPGLTGRTCALDEDAAMAARGADTALREGALVESETAPLTMLPHNDSAFDIVVVNHAFRGLQPERRSAVLNEARRVLRDGGRCIVIEPSGRRGLMALVSGSGPGTVAIESAMTAAGFRAVRTLAEHEGLAFVEAARRR
ncbi:MAG: methyltransferase domain-containing protein [Acidobacteria bacterium]|nr:methyltransferase domain-containing protein [Acidobacteriota bacterium]